MEEKMDKLEDKFGRKLDAQKAFQEELEKKVMERLTVQKEVDKMEMEHQQQKVIIGELDGQQKHQKQQWEKETNALVSQVRQFKDEQKKYLEKVNELEKQQKQLQKERDGRIDKMEKKQQQMSDFHKTLLEKIEAKHKEKQKMLKMMVLKFPDNCWDASACQKDVKITDAKNLIAEYFGDKYNEHSGCHSVFAKHPILRNNDLPYLFYLEISIIKMENAIDFGFAVKEQTKLDGLIMKGASIYSSSGSFWRNGSSTAGKTTEYILMVSAIP